MNDVISLALIGVPLVGAVLAGLWPDDRSRPWWLPAVGGLHLVLVLGLWLRPPPVSAGAWLAFDAIARAVLPVVSFLFLGCAVYAVPYLRLRAERPNRVFVAMLLTVLGLVSAGHQAQHLGLLWIATEAVTLACVPLLHFNGTPRALEATWKYLLVGGTGMALSLLGSFCLGYASLHGGGSGDLTFGALAMQGRELSSPWVVAAWILMLAGYGTKMGLAPMHSWKPDAYGEAPGIVGALLAGGVTTVAFTALLRVRAVVGASGAGALADRTLLGLGLFSLGMAAMFLLGTQDFKRMLAYASVEHMGILSVGTALGAAGLSAALFHVWGNALTKGALFLSAGSLRRAAGSSSLDQVRGMGRLLPVSSSLWVAGLFAATGLPPFASFFSELQVVRASLAMGKGWSAAVLLGCLLLCFLGMSRVVLGVVEGRPPLAVRRQAVRFTESAGLVVPPVVLLVASLWLGLFRPGAVLGCWGTAATQILQP